MANDNPAVRQGNEDGVQVSSPECVDESKMFPRWVYPVLAVDFYVMAVLLCWLPLLPDDAHAVRAALYGIAVASWLSVAWPVAKTMFGNAFQFLMSRQTFGDVARTDVGEMARTTHGVLFPRRGDGFPAGFLVFYYLGFALFQARCVAYFILLLVPWRSGMVVVAAVCVIQLVLSLALRPWKRR